MISARNYELDRSQITLSDIIGVGQFGDVHIGTYRCKQQNSTLPKKSSDTTTVNESGTNENNNDNLNSNNKSGIIHVAVKTCKAEDDENKTEKFLEEACKNSQIKLLAEFNNIIFYRYYAKIRPSSYYSTDWYM